MNKQWVFKIASISLLFNAFLVNGNFPNGLICAKEHGLWMAVGLACLFTGLKIATAKKLNIHVKVLDICILLFLVALPLVYLMDPAKDINSNTILNQTAIGFAYLCLRVLKPNNNIVLTNTLIEILIIVLCFQLFIGFAQYFGVIPIYFKPSAVTGMFFNPGPFAIFTVSIGIIAGILFLFNLKKNKLFNIIFYGVFFLTSSIFVVFSYSRSAWVGGLFGLAVGLLLLTLQRQKDVAAYHLAGLKFFNLKYWLPALFFLLLPFMYWLYQLKTVSANGRLLTWRVTGMMIKDHFISGVGPGNFAVNYLNYQAAFFKTAAHINDYGFIAGDNRFAFNDLLEVFSEKGLIGLGLFLIILSLCVKSIFHGFTQKQRSDYSILGNAILASGLTSILVAGMTSYPLATLPIQILFWFFVAAVVSKDQTKYKRFSVTAVKLPLRVIIAGIFLLLGGYYFHSGIQKWTSYNDWVALRVQPENLGKTMKIAALYHSLQTEPQYLDDISDRYIQAKMYNKAIPYLLMAIQISPNKRLYYNLGKCYEQTNDYKLAAMQYFKVGSAIPNLIKPKYLLAKMYYQQGDFITFKKLATSTLLFVPKINSPDVINMKDELRDLLKEEQSTKKMP